MYWLRSAYINQKDPVGSLLSRKYVEELFFLPPTGHPRVVIKHNCPMPTTHALMGFLMTIRI